VLIERLRFLGAATSQTSGDVPRCASTWCGCGFVLIKGAYYRLASRNGRAPCNLATAAASRSLVLSLA
jgi:hypothetical protein